MHFISLIVLAFAMSSDAFAVAIGRGAILTKRPTFLYALKTGLLFGFIEGLTPLVGWAAGKVAAQWIEQWDHWIAFVLLLGLGLKVLYDAFWGEDDDDEEELGELEQTQSKKAFYLTVLTAIGTSIDAMTVGVTLAFLDVNILLAMVMIGCATMMMVTIGILIGHSVGSKLGKYAEVAGGIVLIIIGSSILFKHLGYFG